MGPAASSTHANVDLSIVGMSLLVLADGCPVTAERGLRGGPSSAKTGVNIHKSRLSTWGLVR